MKLILDETMKEEIEKITGIRYSTQLDFYQLDNIIKDLLCEYHRLEEKLEDLEKGK